MASASQSTTQSLMESDADRTKQDPVTRGPSDLYDPAGPRRTGQITITAALLSALWLVGCALLLALLPDEGVGDLDLLRLAFWAMLALFPIALIWTVTATIYAARMLREDSRRLQRTIDTLRKSQISQAQGGVAEPSIARKLDEIAATTRKAEAALAVFTSTRSGEPAESDRIAARVPVSSSAHALSQGAGEHQPSLELGSSAEDMAPPLAVPDFIRALNFPENAEDAEGFAALRRALKDRATAQLVQASQDVLTLMSQDGIYMDDLRPDLARPEIWRAFAEGTRGRAVAGLGGIRDRASLALVSGRMKQDPIFRDAVHHFLRVFDRVYSDFANRASDADIQAFAVTRTARAFMLLGRVAGTFD